MRQVAQANTYNTGSKRTKSADDVLTCFGFLGFESAGALVSLFSTLSHRSKWRGDASTFCECFHVRCVGCDRLLLRAFTFTHRLSQHSHMIQP